MGLCVCVFCFLWGGVVVRVVTKFVLLLGVRDDVLVVGMGSCLFLLAEAGRFRPGCGSVHLAQLCSRIEFWSKEQAVQFHFIACSGRTPHCSHLIDSGALW